MPTLRAKIENKIKNIAKGHKWSQMIEMMLCKFPEA